MSFSIPIVRRWRVMLRKGQGVVGFQFPGAELPAMKRLDRRMDGRGLCYPWCPKARHLGHPSSVVVRTATPAPGRPGDETARSENGRSGFVLSHPSIRRGGPRRTQGWGARPMDISVRALGSQPSYSAWPHCGQGRKAKLAAAIAWLRVLLIGPWRWTSKPLAVTFPALPGRRL